MSATQMCINDLRAVIKDKEQIAEVALADLVIFAKRIPKYRDSAVARAMMLTQLKNDTDELLKLLHEINGIHEGIRSIG